jgi:phenylalanyl-tRNA synthetase alpha subunit
MKNLIAVCVALLFAAFLCQVAFCQQEQPARRPGPQGAMTAEQREQLMPLMQRLREISQNEQLREVTAEARQNENVKEAQAAVQKAQEALRDAQQKANDVLNKSILEIATKKEMKEVLNLLKERSEILEKMPPQFRGRFPGMGFRGVGPGPAGSRRPQRSTGESSS